VSERKTTKAGRGFGIRLMIYLSASLSLAGVVVAVNAARPSPITRAAFDRLAAGMTRKEVEAALGVPAGEYTTRPCPAPRPSRDTALVWQGDEGTIYVTFARHGGPAIALRFEESEPLPIGPIPLCWYRALRVKLPWSDPTPRPIIY
jgi:hypothetical protein